MVFRKVRPALPPVIGFLTLTAPADFLGTLVRASDENRERVIGKQSGGSFWRFSD